MICGKILFVEDDPVSAAITADGLAQAKRDVDIAFELTHVTTMADALAALSKQPFDAILSDLGLPDSAGTETISSLSAFATGTPIVAFTATDSIPHMFDCLAAGANAYLVKGFSPPSAVIRAILQVIQRQKEQSQLRHAEAHSRAILFAITDALITVDETGIIQSFNAAAERMFGYDEREVLGKEVDLLMPPHQRANHKRNLRQAASLYDTPLELSLREVVGQHKNGKTFPVNISVTEVLHGNNSRCFCAVMRDITEEKKQRNELKKACESAQSAVRAKSAFLANMSHELRTPLTAILGFAETLLLDNCLEDPTERIEAVQTILRNGEHLTGLINDILDLSKIESGRMSIASASCSVFEITDGIINLMSVRAQAKGIDLRARYEGKFPKIIFSDETRLRQILINLLGNAVKFTEIGHVELAVSLVGNRNGEYSLLWEVSDSGIGMTEQECGKLFQPFVQASQSTSRKYGGTGLGLAITKRLVDLLDGELSLESQLGKGSTFRVNIPVGKLQGVPRITLDEYKLFASKNRIIDEQEKDPCVELNCRVLLAEDGPDNQRLIAFILKKQGAKVVVADNGKIACELAMQAVESGNPFDLILMDIQMPVMDGYEATRTLRANGYAGSIVALTAHAMEKDKEKCLEAGCDEYASKPIDREQLIATVAKHAKLTRLSPT